MCSISEHIILNITPQSDTLVQIFLAPQYREDLFFGEAAFSLKKRSYKIPIVDPHFSFSG